MKNGWKYGRDGKCHLYNEGDKLASTRAFQKAMADKMKAEKNNHELSISFNRFLKKFI